MRPLSRAAESDESSHEAFSSGLRHPASLIGVALDAGPGTFKGVQLGTAKTRVGLQARLAF